METIGDEGERSKRVSTDEFDEEEDSVLVDELTNQPQKTEIVVGGN